MPPITAAELSARGRKVVDREVKSQSEMVHTYASQLRAARARLGRLPMKLLLKVQEMKSLHPPLAIHTFLTQSIRADGGDARIITELDVEHFFSRKSPEFIAPLASLPTIHERSQLVKAFAGSTLCGGCLQLPAGARFETRGGMVRVIAARGVTSLVKDLGECADPSCGCYRMSNPHVRHKFRQTVLAQAAALPKLGGTHGGLRYVSVGAGSLLSDLELLLSIEAKHGQPAQLVVVIDKQYAFDVTPVRQFAAALGEATDVHAFWSLDHYSIAAAARPDTFGLADLFVHCDADDVKNDESRRVSAIALAEGGVALQLRQNGAIACWKRRTATNAKARPQKPAGGATGPSDVFRKTRPPTHESNGSSARGCSPLGIRSWKADIKTFEQKLLHSEVRVVRRKCADKVYLVCLRYSADSAPRQAHCV